jgi:hypothetical protein
MSLLYKLTVCFILLTLITKGQHQSGIQYSNYADVITNGSNPASLASSKISIGVNIFNAEVTIFNNYTKWTAPFSFISFFAGTVPNKYRSPGGLVIWQNDYATTNNSKNRINGNASVRLLGPAVYFKIKKANLGIQAGVNIVGFGSFTNTSEEIGRHIVQIRPVGLYGTPMTNNQAKINIGFYKEFYLSLGKRIVNKRSQRLNIGITAKYLTSNNYLAFDATSVDYTVSPSVTNEPKSKTDFQKTEGTFYFAEGNTGISATSILNELTSINSLGTGFGGSIGFTYEYRPEQLRHSKKVDGEWMEKEEEVGYKYRVGVSVEDIGYLNYSGVKVADIESSAQVTFDNDEFRENSRPSLLINLIENKYGTNPADYTTSFSYLTPARVHGFIDYKFKEGKYVTAFVNQSVFSNNRIAPFGQSTFGVVPRFETKNAMLSTPLVVTNNFQHVTLGLTARYRSFYLGTNHLLGFFNFSKTKGVSIYGGLFLSFYTRQKKMENDCYYPGYKQKKKKLPFFEKRKL